MSFKSAVLEGSGLVFGGPGARFWTVWGCFFGNFGSLDRRNAETHFEFELTAGYCSLELQSAVVLTSVSTFGHDLLPQSQAEIFRRSGWAVVSLPGGFDY